MSTTTGAVSRSTGQRNLKRRIISAAVGIPIVFLAVFGGLPGVSVLALLAAVIAGWELASMAGVTGRAKAVAALPPAALTAAVVFIAAAADDTGAAVPVVLIAAGVAGIGITVMLRASMANLVRGASVAMAAAALYFGALLAHGPAVASLASGRDWLIMALIVTFAVDTAAFVTGRSIGKTRLAPRISPNKTWEGAAAGFVAGPAAALPVNALVGPGLDWWVAALAGLALAVAGMLGDLAESGLKRSAGVKDSGQIIPGHGGILDRIDSLAPSIAVVYWVALWSGA
ncbi:MAG: phosphatidate cytidylyltransferase [Dehalococcoidia bacterium]